MAVWSSDRGASERPGDRWRRVSCASTPSGINHDGETVTFSVDGTPIDATVSGRFAPVTLTPFVGAATVELVDPAGCVDPIPVDCS